MEIIVDFDVLNLTFQCNSCGNPLDATEEKGTIMLDPCQTCSDSSYSNGVSDGHDEGYEEGKKDGIDEAKAESE